MKWWKPVAALGALAAAPFVLPALGVGAAGAGAAGAAAGAGSLAVPGLVNTPAVLAGATKAMAGPGLGSMLLGGAKSMAPMLAQSALGYAIGGPQGAMTMPFMPQAAGSRSILGMDPRTVVMGLGGRALGGMPGGLMGMGLAGMHNSGMAGKLREKLGAPALGPQAKIAESASADPTRPKGSVFDHGVPWWM